MMSTWAPGPGTTTMGTSEDVGGTTYADPGGWAANASVYRYATLHELIGTLPSHAVMLELQGNPASLFDSNTQDSCCTSSHVTIEPGQV